ncbi:MAG TPA: glycine zipper domain-containing protein [Tepidisphaeraceae bacterium]|jgi:hypothetical protein
MRDKLGVGLLAGLLLIGSMTGCQSKAGTGALAGGAGGAAIGGAIGSFSHARAGEGALIGGAIGALGGALVGNEMDKADKKKEEQDRYNNDRYYDQQQHSSVGSVAPVTKDEVISMSQRGVRDEVIIDRIERSRTIFHLTAADLTDMRDRGVSESVIRAMEDTSVSSR